MVSTLQALESSVERLHAIVGALDDATIERQAYPREWRIADVLSHIGSGAVISCRRLDDGIDGRAIPDEFAPLVWDEWNAKSPRQKTDDGLTADRVFIDRLQATSAEQRSGFEAPLGPIKLDFEAFVGLRLNEHALHTWDVEVTLDPAATLHPEQVELIVDNLDLIARFTARPTGTTRTIVIATTGPERRFAVELTPGAATFRSGADGDADLMLPAEALIRLVYGRLDRDHMGPELVSGLTDDASTLDELRAVFPGP